MIGLRNESPLAEEKSGTVDFKDAADCHCRITKDTKGRLVIGMFGCGMRLNREQARQVAGHMQRWIETGNIQ